MLELDSNIGKVMNAVRAEVPQHHRHHHCRQEIAISALVRRPSLVTCKTSSRGMQGFGFCSIWNNFRRL